jgi:hypothetical protein
MRNKKYLKTILLLVVLCMFAIGCADNKNAESSTSVSEEDVNRPATVQTVSEEDIKSAVKKIHTACEFISDCASYQIDHWSTNSELMNWYFSDTAYKDANSTDSKMAAKRAYESRVSARENLTEAKVLLGTNGEGEYYNAAKNYYISVDKYLTLVSTFPEGYSLLTYSDAVKDAKDDCSSAYSEVSFYN